MKTLSYKRGQLVKVKNGQFCKGRAVIKHILDGGQTAIIKLLDFPNMIDTERTVDVSKLSIQN